MIRLTARQKEGPVEYLPIGRYSLHAEIRPSASGDPSETTITLSADAAAFPVVRLVVRAFYDAGYPKDSIQMNETEVLAPQIPKG